MQMPSADAHSRAGVAVDVKLQSGDVCNKSCTGLQACIVLSSDMHCPLWRQESMGN
jgi:hypothetical protein